MNGSVDEQQLGIRLALMMLALASGALACNPEIDPERHNFQMQEEAPSAFGSFGQNSLSVGHIEVYASTPKISYEIIEATATDGSVTATSAPLPTEFSNALYFTQDYSDSDCVDEPVAFRLTLLKAFQRDEAGNMVRTFYRDSVRNKFSLTQSAYNLEKVEATDIDEAAPVYLASTSNDSTNQLYLQIDPTKFEVPDTIDDAYDYFYSLTATIDLVNTSFRANLAEGTYIFFTVTVYREPDSCYAAIISNRCDEPVWKPSDVVYKRAIHQIIIDTEEALTTFASLNSDHLNDLMEQRTMCQVLTDTEYCNIQYVETADWVRPLPTFADITSNGNLQVTAKQKYEKIPPTGSLLSPISDLSSTSLRGIWRFQVEEQAMDDANPFTAIYYVRVMTLCDQTDAYFFNPTAWEAQNTFTHTATTQSFEELDQIDFTDFVYSMNYAQCGDFDIAIDTLMLNDEVQYSSVSNEIVYAALTSAIALESNVLKITQSHLNNFDNGDRIAVNVVVSTANVFSWGMFLRLTYNIDIDNDCAIDQTLWPTNIMDWYAANQQFTQIVRGSEQTDLQVDDLLGKTYLPRVGQCEDVEGYIGYLALESVTIATGTALDLANLEVPTEYQPLGMVNESTGSPAGHYPLWIDTSGDSAILRVTTTSDTPLGSYSYQTKIYGFPAGDENFELTNSNFVVLPFTIEINAEGTVFDEEAEDDEDNEEDEDGDEEENEADEEDGEYEEESALSDVLNLFLEAIDEDYILDDPTETALTIELPSIVTGFGTDGDYSDYAFTISEVSPAKFASFAVLSAEKASLIVGPFDEEPEEEIVIVFALSDSQTTETLYTALSSSQSEFDPADLFDSLEDEEPQDGDSEEETNLEGEAEDEEEEPETEDDEDKATSEDEEQGSEDEGDEDDEGEEDVEKDSTEILNGIEELKDQEIDVENLSESIGALFGAKLSSLPDSRKQEILGDLLKARTSSLTKKASTSAVAVKKPAKPELDFEPIQPDGSFSMLFDKGVVGLDLLNQIGVEITAKGTVSDLYADDSTPQAEALQSSERRRRLQSTDDTASIGFDLSQYISFELRRGDEDSAPVDKLGFKIVVSSLDQDSLDMSLVFENPQMVSIGSNKDVVIGIIQDESFFSSKDSYVSVKKGTEIRVILPKMLPGADVVLLLDQANVAMENTAQTLMTGQLIMTLVLSVSLKSMWNLLNVMQVLAYLRSFTSWPALIELITKNIIEAIYLKQFTNAVMDYGKTKFEVAKSVTKDEYLRQQGIEDNSAMKNLGVFAVSLALILFVVLIFYLVKVCASKVACCGKVQNILSKKIFYNGPIRYVIVGYLKLFNQFVTMLLLAYANDQGTSLIVAYGLIVAFLTLWPIWTEYFLIKNREQLNTQSFRQKFQTLYQGFNTDSFSALCYNAVFSVRRFDLILLNVYFTVDSPLSGFDRTMYLQKIMGFLILQTFYLSYIHAVKPHEEKIYNTVELVNEYSLVALAYCMLNYTQLSPVPIDDKFNRVMEFVVVGIIGVMVVINVSAMILTSTRKIIKSYQRKKAQKLAREQMGDRRLVKINEKVIDLDLNSTIQKNPSGAPKLNRFNRVKLSKKEAKQKRKKTMLQADTTQIPTFTVIRNTSVTTNNTINIVLGSDVSSSAPPTTSKQDEPDVIEVRPIGITFSEKKHLLETAAQIKQELKQMRK